MLPVLLLCLVGCQSGGYRASQLPPELRVSSARRTKSIDLSRLTSPGVSDAIIAPHDLLEVSVATGREDETKPMKLRVADDGSVEVPIIGPVPVAGMEAYQAGQNITNLAIERGMYRHPFVTVEIKSKAVNRITVLGEAKEPGTYELPRGSSDVISAIAAAGGINEEAGTTIEVIRQSKMGSAHGLADATEPAETDDGVQLAAYQNLGTPPAIAKRSNPAGKPLSPRTERIDLAANQPWRQSDLRLSDRDVIRILPKQKELIHVTGLVVNPGQFELPDDQEIHMLDAIALAGGAKSPVADKVFVIRRIGSQPQPLVIQASISKAKRNGLENLQLLPGDTVSIEQTTSTAIVDTLGKFLRLSFGVASSTVF